jgi:filamentous hemagglutinin
VACAVGANSVEILDVPGRVLSRVNLRNGSQAEGAGFNHVIAEHFSGKASKSEFTVSQNELKAILQSKEVVQSPVSRILESADGPRYVREIDLGRSIGLDKFSSRQPTSTMTVLTDRYGNLVTTTPGKIK